MHITCDMGFLGTSVRIQHSPFWLRLDLDTCAGKTPSGTPNNVICIYPPCLEQALMFDMYAIQCILYGFPSEMDFHITHLLIALSSQATEMWKFHLLNILWPPFCIKLAKLGQWGWLMMVRLAWKPEDTRSISHGKPYKMHVNIHARCINIIHISGIHSDVQLMTK